jgi:hypothetical protein
MFQALKFKPDRWTKLFQFKARRQELLDLNQRGRDRPVKPIGVVNGRLIALRNMILSSFRNVFVLPWLVGLCITVYWQVDDFYTSWSASEKSHQRFVAAEKKIHGKDFFETRADKVELRMYNRLDKSGKMSFKTYWHYRYYEIDAAERFRRGDIVLAIFYLISIPGLSYMALRMKRIAPLCFDRERRIIYTWSKGRVMAQYYDDAWLYQNFRGIDFALYAFDNGNPKNLFFSIQPGGNPWINNPKTMDPAFSSITKFMEYGRDAVLDHDWKGRRGVFLFEDKKPDDFDEQLEKVLTFIREEKINEQAEELARQWGFLEVAPEQNT